MVRKRSAQGLWAGLAAFAWLSAAASAEDGAPVNAVTPGTPRIYSTLHSIGVEWDVTGDANHNATCTARYRAQGAAEWKEALPLFRIDWEGWYGPRKADRPYNMLAGSILFLQPGAPYEVRLSLSDPDGGQDERTLTIRTRAVPARPTGGRTWHAAPGEGGGSGTQADPFRGIAAAEAAAQPGDSILLHAGDYGAVQFQKSGLPGRYLVWKGDGEPVFTAATLTGSHLWLERLAFKSPVKPDPAGLKNISGGNGLRANGAPQDVVVTRCRFNGYHYSIMLSPDARAWYIADNVIKGDMVNSNIGGISGEGIELLHSSDHDVAYNRISNVADGVSYTGRNCDVYGNDLRDLTDDGIEPDYGYANNRFWNNRILRAFYHGFSFQPQYCGPWYFIRNEVFTERNMLKGNVADRFVLVNNTLVSTEPYAERDGGIILKSLSRNNLWILIVRKADPKRPAVMWYGGLRREVKYLMELPGEAQWYTDVDYDGFDWDTAPTPFAWNVGPGRPNRFKTLEAFSKEVGIEKHAIRVHRKEIFEVPDILAYVMRPFAPERLTLKAGCNAIDAGQALPNICDDFTGNAPDLGAYEFGRPPTHYGPRPEKE